MLDKIQPRKYLSGGDMDGILYNRSQRRWQPQRPVSLRERRQGCPELELARQRLELHEPCVAFRKSLISLLLLQESFVLRSVHANRRAVFLLQ